MTMHQQTGFTVNINSVSRAKDYHFKYLDNSKEFVVNDLFKMGFTTQEINNASISQMSPDEAAEESKVDDIEW